MDRRHFLSAAASSGALLVAGCAELLGSDEGFSFDGDPDRWPQAFHDPANTGRNPAATGPRSLEREWVYEPVSHDSGIHLRFMAPVVRDGTVFVNEHWMTHPDNSNGGLKLLALDGSDGSYWGEITGGGSRMTEFGLVVDGAEIVNVVAYEWEQLLIAGSIATLFDLTRYDSETGDPSGSVDLDQGMGAPTLADGRLFCYTVNGIRSVDLDDERVDWEFEYTEFDLDEGEMPLGEEYPPAVVDETVYGVAGQEVVAVEVGADEPLWTVDATEEFPDLWNAEHYGQLYQPTVMDGLVYTTLGVTPNVDFEAKTDGKSPEQNGGVVAIDADSGEIEWTWQPAVDGWAGVTGCAPAIGDGYVYVCGYEGHPDEETDPRLYAIDADRGEVAWNESIAGNCEVPVAAEETVYVVTTDEVAAFDAVSGEKLARDSLEGEEYSANPGIPPAVVDGQLVVPTADGVIAYTDSSDGI